MRPTHPYVLALQEVRGPRPPDGRQEPDRVGADQPLQQPDITRGERTAALTALALFRGAVLHGAHGGTAHHALQEEENTFRHNTSPRCIWDKAHDTQNMRHNTRRALGD